MFLIKFCCANEREQPKPRTAMDPSSNSYVEGKLAGYKEVFVQYRKFEKSLGVHELDVVSLQELMLEQFSHNEIPKRDLQQTFNRLEALNLKQIKKVLTQGIFFTDSARQCYDSTKI